MAKIRVYEFARDLNMTNRELLDKIRDLDIDVNSHMSSLDEDVVAKVKSVLFGERDDQLEEKRVRPTVIRRRKVVPHQVPDTPEVESTSAAEPDVPPAETEEQAPVAVEVKTPPGKKPVVKKRKPAPSAKIIAKPKTDTPEAPPAAAEPELVDTTPAIEAAEPDAQTADESTPVNKSAAPPADDDAAAGDAVSGPPSAEEPPKAPVAKAKKGKKEAAAKIIKLQERRFP
jgi:translation initiation factor IF-2